MEAFAKELAEVRNLDTKDTYKEQLNKLETEYQFVLLRSLTFFHKEMGRSNLLERLHLIKEQLCDTTQGLAYPTNLPLTGANQNIKTCRHCKRDTLQLRQFSNELCCENCGLLKKPWMASRLITMHSIIVVETTRLSNEDEPTDPTTSDITSTNI